MSGNRRESRANEYARLADVRGHWRTDAILPGERSAVPRVDRFAARHLAGAEPARADVKDTRLADRRATDVVHDSGRGHALPAASSRTYRIQSLRFRRALSAAARQRAFCSALDAR